MMIPVLLQVSSHMKTSKYINIFQTTKQYPVSASNLHQPPLGPKSCQRRDSLITSIRSGAWSSAGPQRGHQLQALAKRSCWGTRAHHSAPRDSTGIWDLRYSEI